ncbi:glycoside hydrolase family 15 protein [Sistotremastrum niveocremeum HHB9708]|uniref:Glucoamylase n=1 Tax=Sistotremastrum niveocremeum HHB9708 TaxID=1314777 RepID=A0A165ADL6_9AGAM|nr:glycoside hydrolase family 15 protein [Sistotremastrum niveocremeum HHB9708]
MRLSLLFPVLSPSLLVLSQTLSSYISTEQPIAKTNLLANIGAAGVKAPGAKPGIVVASPSTVNPNYYYFWLRDGSLVFKYIVDEYVSGRDTSLLSHINDFVAAQTILQGVDNPSGTAAAGTNLGEPKYYVNETAFLDSWGRPQRDGPALRITALTTYANSLLAANNKTFVTNSLWPIILKDANYVSSFWNQSTFDLWEEIQSSSFFTTAVQHRSLREAITLANAIGQTSQVSAWTTQANNILCFLQSYWNPSAGYITANTGGGRSGIDANTVLASIHTFDPNAGCDATTFQPCSDKALSNLKVYVDSFRSVYSLNSGVAESSAVSTGRYKEDVYQGGNPWYLTTLAVSEQLHLALKTWSTAGSLTITSTSLPFFQIFSSSVTAGTYSSTSSTYTTLTSAISTYADGFISIVQKYTPSNGGLAEQFDKSSGVPVSAVDLTWSYASALTAFNARAGLLSNSWGAKGLSVSGTCQSNAGPTVSVTFNVQATTSFGENIFITGSDPALSSWNPSSAIALSAANYPTWSVTVKLPASAGIQYKYIRKETDGSIVWESDPNMQITTPASGSVTENDTWR